MSEVRISISVPPGAIVQVVDSTQTGGSKSFDIHVDFGSMTEQLELPSWKDVKLDITRADELDPVSYCDRVRIVDGGLLAGNNAEVGHTYAPVDSIASAGADYLLRADEGESNV